MKTEIIVIGDELLIGQVIDTNSAWMAAELNRSGWDVCRVTTVRDDANAITDAITAAFRQVDVILMTGGLGPTSDDITKPVLCRYFGGRLIFNEEVFRQVKRYFAGRNLPMNESTRRQAEVPDTCTVIPNPVGTAPIMWFENNNKTLVSMPGVPHEMHIAMKSEIIPRLRQRYNNHDTILHRTLLVYRNTESGLSERLTAFEASLPDGIQLAYLPTPGFVRLRLTARGPEEPPLTKHLNRLTTDLRQILGQDILAEEDTTLAGALGKILLNKNCTVATAESCTGGNIAREITAIAGSSAYYNGSVVAYHNQIKQDLLQVPAELLQKHGAVSREVVEAMASGAQQALSADCSMATSGIAGPDGGTPQKPVGTVWMAARYGNRTITECGHFSGSRSYIIERATQHVILMLIKLLNDTPQDSPEGCPSSKTA